MVFKKVDLDNALAAVAEGLSANSYVKLSTAISLYPSNGELYLVTYPDDGEVWYRAKVGTVSADFKALSVDGAQFTKAVSFCDADVELIATEDSLIIKNGKGELKLPVIVDDNNAFAVHEFFEPTGNELTVSHLAQLKMVSANVAKTMDSIAVRNVYTDENVSFSTDFENISKGDSIVNTPMLLTGRMLNFLAKHPDTKISDAGQEYFWFVSTEDNCAARFSKVFQDYLAEFPVEALKKEFESEVQHSVTLDLPSFLNSLSFLAIVADSVNDYAVIIAQETPNELILKCGQSIQTIPCESVKGDGPWSITVNCTAANTKFALYDGKVQLDVYESQLACVGQVVTSIGRIPDEPAIG